MRTRLIAWITAAFMCCVPVMAQHGVGMRNIKIGVILPLKDASQRGQKMVEFYQGILLAVDSLRHGGVNVDVVALHSGSKEVDMTSLLATNNLSDRDVVFGPLDAAQLPALADYCQRNSVRLVVPFIPNTNLLKNNPLQYVVTAPRAQVQAQAVALALQKFSNSHVVFVDAQDSNEEGRQFETQMRAVLSARGAFMRTVNIGGDDNEYAAAFNPLRHNIVVVNSSSIRAINTLMPRLRDYKNSHPDCQFSLLGYPTWQTFTNTLLNDFYRFDTYIYTSFYRHPLAYSTHEFDNTFMSWFHQPMANTFPRWGMMGFDVAWFFLRGLSLYGDSLESRIGQVPTNPFQSPFTFAHLDNDGGYLNIFVELVHYTPSQSIELLPQ